MDGSAKVDTPRLTANVFGRFSIRDAEGCDVCPRPMKARGVLALLVAAPGAERSRAWLQSKLWSDRGPEQAAGSLRRALSDIRKSFGPYKDALRADFDSVSLDLDLIAISYDRPETQIGGIEPEPFEGIDVKDLEFEALIRDMRESLRSQVQQPPASEGVAFRAPQLEAAQMSSVSGQPTGLATSSKQARNTVIIENQAPRTGLSFVASQVFIDRLVRYLGQLGAFEILQADGSLMGQNRPENAGQAHLCVVRIVATDLADGAFLGCEIQRLHSHQKLWSDHAMLTAEPHAYRDNLDLAKLARDATGSLCNAFAEQPAGGSAEQYAFYYAQRAIGLLFQLDADCLTAAEELLVRAHEVSPQGQFLAWRAYLRLTDQNQHHGNPGLAADGQSEHLLSAAMRAAPDNPTVRAICSQLELFHQGNRGYSLEMANLAFEANSADPLNCAMLSNALMRNGRPSEGYEVARRALHVSKEAPNHYYFHHFACMAAAATGEYETALWHAGVGLGIRPEFTSLRRYQIALAAQTGDTEQVHRSLAALQAVEPGFQLSDLSDPRYPVPSLRTLPLIDVVAAL